MDAPKDLYAMWMARGLSLGTPLNEVLDKIRAEIIRERDGDMGGSQEIINGFIYGCNRSLDIIDKYREEQE